MDRTEINRALAKALAYKQCGKQADAEEWARTLVTLLECADILTPADDDPDPAPDDFTIGKAGVIRNGRLTRLDLRLDPA